MVGVFEPVLGSAYRLLLSGIDRSSDHLDGVGGAFDFRERNEGQWRKRPVCVSLNGSASLSMQAG
jgi:hypothetical protein